MDNLTTKQLLDMKMKIISNDGMEYDIPFVYILKASVLKEYYNDTKQTVFYYEGDSTDIVTFITYLKCGFPEKEEQLYTVLKLIDFFGCTLSCAICRKDCFDSKLTQNVAIGKCLHYYHTECIANVVERIHKCPCCRDNWVYMFIIHDSVITGT